MIKHHPENQILQQFAAGELPASVSVAVAIHVEMCPKCQQSINEINQQLAAAAFVEDNAVEQTDDLELDDILHSITNDESVDVLPRVEAKYIKAGDSKFIAPTALTQLQLSDWNGFGKVNRSRVSLEDNEIRSSLLHIEAGGEIPSHTHNGSEVTVLLDGSFKDEMGEYHKGDFIWLDGHHEHNPISDNGCVCYAVVTDALHFSQGISRLLNPIGKLIY